MENKRQFIHMTMVSFALLLRWLNWWQALLCATTAIIVNVFVMPRIGKATYREEDLKRGIALGMVFYSVSVFIMILLLPLPVAAVGWAIMALGDGMATVSGIKWGKSKLPWNSDKSWAGLAGFAVFGSIAATLLFMWCQPNVLESTPLWASEVLAPMLDVSKAGATVKCVLATLLAAILESLPIGVDDNLLVPLASSGFFMVLYSAV